MPKTNPLGLVPEVPPLTEHELYQAAHCVYREGIKHHSKSRCALAGRIWQTLGNYSDSARLAAEAFSDAEAGWNT